MADDIQGVRLPPGVNCKGSWVLGSACGRCERCDAERIRLGIPEGHTGKWPPTALTMPPAPRPGSVPSDLVPRLRELAELSATAAVGDMPDCEAELRAAAAEIEGMRRRLHDAYQTVWCLAKQAGGEVRISMATAAQYKPGARIAHLPAENLSYTIRALDV